MILWITVLISGSDISYVRQVVCYSETSSCEVLNKENSDDEKNRFQSVLTVV